MKIVAIMGSYRKERNIDTLIDKAIEGAKSKNGAEVEKILLIEKDIKYCKNCMVCKKDAPEKEIATCVIPDDMQEIYPKLNEADAIIMACPVNMGHVTAVMKTFLERICWVIGKPAVDFEADGYEVKGCPGPRSKKRKKAIIIVSSGMVPPEVSHYCDEATSLMSDMCDILNAEVVGKMYAGAVEVKGIEEYSKEAYELGKKLV